MFFSLSVSNLLIIKKSHQIKICNLPVSSMFLEESYLVRSVSNMHDCLSTASMASTRRTVSLPATTAEEEDGGGGDGGEVKSLADEVS